ncbi:DUF1800 family protein [Ferrovibrio sp.]|uniref:DUF1800 domain-containing protein n=1 Tax=Ferrovibrio sp. TaxID=1917215 RepID=UPI0035B3C64C
MLPSQNALAGQALNNQAIIAANRFGFGATPAEAGMIAADPRGWLLRQVPPGPAAPLPPALRDLPGAEKQAADFYAYRLARKEDQAEAEKAARQVLQKSIQSEVAALFVAQMQTDTPFVERWVQFWANHFCVSGRDQIVFAMAGAYEREAIRPHAFGRFADMLLAATWHPAMLIYLDNASSIGPGSRAGGRRNVGLNENHAREILELHTVSRTGGYDQNDVIALAKILTGWTVTRNPNDGFALGKVGYRPQWHEPGMQILLGWEFPQQGEDQGEAALQMLAVHPSTAQHVAEKLARHFIADDPPKAAVAALAKSFKDSGGDLRKLAIALIERPEAWKPEYRKLRTPRDFMLAAARLGNPDMNGQRFGGLLRQFGQTTFQPPSPAGWPDRSGDWLAPDALRQRIELSFLISQRVKPGPLQPDALLQIAVGEGVSPETRHAVQRAESRQVALATIFAAPEFQWR